MSKYSATLFLLLVLSCLYPSASFAQSILQKMMDETNDGDTLYIEKNDYNSDNSEVSANISLSDMTDQAGQIHRADFPDVNNHTLGQGDADFLQMRRL